jgi:hypothetical protein
MARLGLGLLTPLAEWSAFVEGGLFLLICGGLVLAVRWDKARQRRSWEDIAPYEDDDQEGFQPKHEETVHPRPGISLVVPLVETAVIVAAVFLALVKTPESWPTAVRWLVALAGLALFVLRPLRRIVAGVTTHFVVTTGYEEAAGPTRRGVRMAHLYLEGMNGQIEVGDEFVVIHRKGLLAKQGHVFGNKGVRIRLSDIHDIQISYPRLGKNGWLTFISGSTGGPVTDLMKAIRDESTVMFKKRSTDEFDEFRQQVLALIASRNNEGLVEAIAAGVAASSRPDFATQLRELAALRDDGLLDEAEFQAKKAQLMQER